MMRCLEFIAYENHLPLSTCFEVQQPKSDPPNTSNQLATRFASFFSIIGLVVEFVVAIDEARVRFTDDAHLFYFYFCQSICFK
ncbi:hypothetical protein N7541_006778 [Penicillium brevicompactum]|uniref:Uncharacterized protein n=1 Tax=Penicillium brevicompactum TaxID=5074 RepID=A0A9W9R8L2_PENBR|nr:hypothetical protein N7541_006778 [Penicillium brevicompactum]